MRTRLFILFFALFSSCSATVSRDREELQAIAERMLKLDLGESKIEGKIIKTPGEVSVYQLISMTDILMKFKSALVHNSYTASIAGDSKLFEQVFEQFTENERFTHDDYEFFEFTDRTKSMESFVAIDGVRSRLIFILFDF